MPGIAGVQTVGRDNTALVRDASDRLKLKAASRARVGHLRLERETQYLRIQTLEIGGLVSGYYGCWIVKPAKVDAITSNLIHNGVVYTVAVVRAHMEIEIALVQPAELENVVPTDLRDIIFDHVVLAIPEALADVLRIDVIGNQCLR